MSEPQEQTDQAADAPSQAASAEREALLLATIQKLEKNNSKLLDERKADASKLQAYEEKAQAQLLADGKGDQLVDALKGTVREKDSKIAELENQVGKLQAEYQQKEIQTAALSVIQQAGAISPSQVFSLVNGEFDLRMQDGKPVAIVGGIETDLAQHLNTLKQAGSGWDHQFAGSGARGMSASGSVPNSAGQKSWASMNVTERILLQEQDVRNGTNFAEQLKAQG